MNITNHHGKVTTSRTDSVALRRFDGKTALVTGAAMGLGAEIAKRLAHEGARLLVADIDASKGQQLATALAGGGHVFLEADLGRTDSAAQLAEQTAAAVDGLDVLVNNAGVVRPARFEEISDEDWELQVAVNLRAPLLLTKALLPLLRDRGAAIVNVSSEAGFRPRSSKTIYDTTKAGIGGLTRSLAAELWQYRIRVNEVAPGGMVTEMHFASASDPAATKRQLEDAELDEGYNIMRRLGRPAEVAAAVAFLASDDAAFITASTLHVDGGMGLG
ncbi:SDR family NAD(P)-dependent oxidoreductase [Mesorhizobium sp. M1348]|uniref:SDR family NAD(P)-dependent oxidoreductase n=1 Tax=Mesorhizobium sp. M1348 TaxID=2957089 RepID=UPI003335EF23